MKFHTDSNLRSGLKPETPGAVRHPRSPAGHQASLSKNPISMSAERSYNEITHLECYTLLITFAKPFLLNAAYTIHSLLVSATMTSILKTIKGSVIPSSFFSKDF